MSNSKNPAEPRPEDVIGLLLSVETIHRRLLEPVQEATGLAPRTAEILVFLYGCAHLGWEVCPLDSDGFLLSKDLRQYLGQTSATWMRELRALEGAGLIETAGVQPELFDGSPKIHRAHQRIRLTPKGTGIIAAVHDEWRKLSHRLSGAIPDRQLLQCLRMVAAMCAEGAEE